MNQKENPKKKFIEKKFIEKELSEFKEFITRGNVMDLSVGVIVGGAFSSIVTSLVNNILMPIIGIFLGGVNFSGLHIRIGSATIMYGAFVQSVIDFLIIAFCIFVFIKIINGITRKKEKKEEAKVEVVPAKSAEVVLLEEIRDLLKKDTKPQKSKKKAKE